MHRKLGSCVALLLVLCHVIGAIGCNLYGALDPPTSRDESYAAALARVHAGDCKGGKDLLESVQPADGDVAVALGWAYMCIAGASASSIASSVYKYTSASNDLTVIGQLARTMLPMDPDKYAASAKAIEAFQKVFDSRRGIEIAIGRLVRAAAILANQHKKAADDGKLQRNDTAAAACNGVSNCATGGPGVCTAGMSDADATEFTTTITDAASDLGGSSAADLSKLAAAIRDGLGGTGDLQRCFITNSVIPST